MNWKQPPTIEQGKPRKAKPKGGKALTKARMNRAAIDPNQQPVKTRAKKVAKAF